MRRIRFVAIGLLLTATLVSLACSDDGTMPTGTPPSTVKNLTQKSDVLYNVEVAYNYRRIDWYEGALDPNFTFFLSTGDINNGLPEQWDRATEILYNSRLFDKNYATLPCQSTFVDIKTEEGVTWTESDSPLNPGEKWYTTTLFYDFKFEIAPNTYIPLPGAKAEFTVRDAGPSGMNQHHWQLVEMTDLGGASLVASSSSTTKPNTWGAVKSLYRG